jgi:hypothetical protein
MATGATGQLGLALPVQGELTGTWGNTVNNGITQYTNIAIAATLTLTGDGAVTLANTTGDATASNITSSLTGAGTVTAQFAIVRITGTLTTTKVITAPSYSKTYVVVNAATGGAVTFKASGQTGVSVAVGESAYAYYNGTDYVKIASNTQTLISPTIESGTFNNGYTEEVFAVTGTTPALSPTNGSIQTWTLSANSTPTAGTWASGQSLTLMVDDGTAYSITWFAITWKTDGGTAPTLNTSGYTAIQLWKVDAVIYGARVGDA